MDNDEIAEDKSLSNANETKETVLSLSTESVLANKKCIACDFSAMNFDLLHNHQTFQHTTEELSYYIVQNLDPLFIRKPLCDITDKKNLSFIPSNANVDEPNVPGLFTNAQLNHPPLRRPHQFSITSTNTVCSNSENTITSNVIPASEHKSTISENDLVFLKSADGLCNDLMKLKQNNKFKKKCLNRKKHIPCNIGTVLKRMRKPDFNKIFKENQVDAIFGIPSNESTEKIETVNTQLLGDENNSEVAIVPSTASSELIEDHGNIETFNKNTST